MSPRWPAGGAASAGDLRAHVRAAAQRPAARLRLGSVEARSSLYRSGRRSAGRPAAVDATAGQVLRFGPGFAQVAYSSCCGGHTEASSDAWGGAAAAVSRRRGLHVVHAARRTIAGRRSSSSMPLPRIFRCRSSRSASCKTCALPATIAAGARAVSNSSPTAAARPSGHGFSACGRGAGAAQPAGNELAAHAGQSRGARRRRRPRSRRRAVPVGSARAWRRAVADANEILALYFPGTVIGDYDR